MSPYWLPWWVQENRIPKVLGGKPSPLMEAQSSASAPPESKWFWGNMPAIDVLRLQDNEGESYAQDVGVLFAGK